MARILVVDDEPGMRDLLSILLNREGHTSVLASSGDDAWAQVEGGLVPDLVIQDLRMPGISGLELLQRLTRRFPGLPVVVITAYATWDNTVEAMRLGAFAYVKKPFDTDEIRLTIARGLEQRRLLAGKEGRAKALLELVGASPALLSVVDVARRAAATEATVLIQGESGTGKELIARICHVHSARASKPFIAVNCGAFTETLLESELFGHEMGAFTGAVAKKDGLLRVADGGTFFLDEVGEMSLATQVRLLRVLEERKLFPVGGTRPESIDVRFVCATNRDLAEEVRAGRFRADLFYRLNVIPVTLPPLRERPEDIPLLAGHFVRRYARRMGREIRGIAPGVEAALTSYSWPGNIRELENVIQRAIALSKGDVLTDVPLLGLGGAATGSGARGGWAAVPPADDAEGRPSYRPAPPPLPPGGFDLEATLAHTERVLLERALIETEGNVTRAAELLGITFRSMRYKLKKLGMRAGTKA